MSSGEGAVERAMGEGVLHAVDSLVAHLRLAGIAVPTASAIDAREALGHLDTTVRGDLRTALRACLVKRVEDLATFDQCFAASFPQPATARLRPRVSPGELVDRLVSGDLAGLDDLAAAAVERYGGAAGTASERYRVQRVMRALQVGTALQGALAAQRGAGRRTDIEERLALADLRQLATDLERLVREHVRRTGTRGGPGRRLDEVEFLSATPDELRQMRHTVQPLARQLARRVGRRRRQTRRNARVDVRRTIHNSLGSGGVLHAVAYVRHRPRQPDLWLVCDVSGSVAEFARFTLGLLYAMHEEFPRVHAFTFVDKVDDVGDLLEHRAYDVDPFHVLTRASVVRGSARSDYGAAGLDFLCRHGHRLTPSSTVIVTGDARSNWRDPGVAAFAAIAERARRTYLWNPEPHGKWDTGDSVVGRLRPCFDAIEEVRTIAQLAGCIEAIG
ncbi:MAG: VWA domain-containing protein [Acidimicrobiales bacterium]